MIPPAIAAASGLVRLGRWGLRVPSSSRANSSGFSFQSGSGATIARTLLSPQMANIGSGFILFRSFQRASCLANSGWAWSHQLRITKSGFSRACCSGTRIVFCRGTISPKSPGMNHRTPKLRRKS